jgi:hypothetical protein
MAIKVQGSTIIDDSRNIINATQVGIATTTTSQSFQVGSGTTIVVVNNLGNLGIGTTNPTSKLTVVGDVLVSGIVTAASFRGDGSQLFGVSGGVSISTNTTNQNQFLTYAISTGTTTGLGVTTSGLVFNPSTTRFGIGITNPQYTFTVTDTGTPATTGLTNCLADFTTTANSYGQINLRNTSTGTNASSDVIITTDNGNDSTNFIDLGINNSGFSVGSWTINGANDGYLYTSDGNLSIGAINASVAKYISFFTGGTLLSNERMRINTTGVGIGTTNPTSALTVSGSALVTGISTIGNLRVTPIGTGVTVGSAGVVTYYGDGSGLTNIQVSSTTDSYLFNTGISSSFSTTLVGIGSTIFTFPATAGKKYVILSVNCSNVSTGNTEVNVIGAFDFNGGERSYFAYNIPIPTGTAVEIMKQPQVLNPSDRIVMRSTNFSRVGTDSIVEVYVSYQEKTTTSYFGIGISTTGFATTDVTGIYTATTYPSVIQSIRLANVTDSGGYPVSVQITNGLTTTRLVDNLIVPKYGSVELLDAPKRIETNSVIQLQLDQAYTISAQVSGSQITS